MAGVLDRLAPAIELAGRLLLAAIFLHEGFGKILAYTAAASYAQAFGVPDSLLTGAIALEIGGGLCIAAGGFTRPAALSLALFSLATAVIFHSRFAEVNQLLHFEKNLAIAGGFLILAVHGSGKWSLDALRQGRSQAGGAQALASGGAPGSR